MIPAHMSDIKQHNILGGSSVDQRSSRKSWRAIDRETSIRMEAVNNTVFRLPEID